MHMVLRGAFLLRHYQRLADEPDALLLRPTIDRTSRPGDRSSISDQRDNVHWFIATRGPAYTLDVIVAPLDPERGHWNLDYVDPDHAQPLGDGTLRVPRLSGIAEGIARYGKAS